MKHRNLLTGCFALSLCLHIAVIVCFQKYSFWFSSFSSQEPNENWLNFVDKKERDEILKVAFETTKAPHEEKESAMHPELENSIPFTFHTSLSAKDPEDPFPFFHFPFPIEEPLVTHSILPVFSIPTQSFNLLDHLPKDLIIPTPSKTPQSLFPPIRADVHLHLAAKSPLVPEMPPSALIAYSNEMEVDLSSSSALQKSLSLMTIPDLPKLPTLAELDTCSYSDSFETDLVFLPKDDEKGYLFALTLIPRPELNLPRLAQHITFLIDRSNSIQQGRLNAAKTAVQKVLEELLEEDTFNIIAFDSKMEKLSPHPLPCTQKSYALAQNFLEKIQLGSFFSTTDLFKPLLLTIPGAIDPNELHSAILLTDGEALAKPAAQKGLLHDWTQYNQGRVSLFILGLSDTYATSLDAAASFNRGKFTQASTNRGLKRKLFKLLKNTQNPIAKNLSCHAISKSPQTKINLYPKTTGMPHLYLDQPYVILGETETLDDFILFVQGKLKNRWLNVKKTISFLAARKGNKTLKQELALQHAHEFYEKYALDQNPKHLAEAKALLELHPSNP